MDFYILLIVLFCIIICVLFWKIEEKKWLISFLWVYLFLLIFSYQSIWFHYMYVYWEFIYSEMMMQDLIQSYMVSYLIIFYCSLFFIFYFLCYFLYFIWKKKNIDIKKKIYILIRDFITLGIIFLLFWVYVDAMWKYSKYYSWYLNPQIFWWEEFICMDESVTLILDRTHPHPVIVNPYNNYFDFYKKYWWYMSNTLPKELIRDDFLQTCINKNWENYYEKYYYLYGKYPSASKPYRDKYILNGVQIEEIVTKLKEKRKYIHNVIKHSYKEFDLWITLQEFDEWFPSINLHEKLEEKRKLVYWDTFDSEEYKYFEKFMQIPDEVQSKKQLLYSKERYIIPEWFFRRVKEKNKGWAEIYTDWVNNYTTTPTKLYINTDLKFWSPYLVLWATSSFYNVWKAGQKMSVEFSYADVKNIPEFQENNCEDTIFFYKDTYWKCHLENKDNQWDKLVCDNANLLLDYELAVKKYQDFEKCSRLKYKKVSTDIWTGWERMNEKYALQESKNMFEFKGNHGFIARRDEGYFIMYNWYQISEYFDYIRTRSCCAIWKFPFKIYENGILEFVFQRDEKLFVWFIEL